MSLTETLIRQTKPQPKPIKLFDGSGLFLLVMPTDSRCWRLKYRFEGREKLLAFGVYPDVPMRLARDRREQARQFVARGIDPSAKRQAEKASRADTYSSLGSAVVQ